MVNQLNLTEKDSIEALDQIVKKMVATVESSREEVFEFSEASRQDFEAIKIELAEVQAYVKEIIRQSDELELTAKRARSRLAEVSKSFNKFSEEQVRDAYEVAYEVHGKIQLLRQAEAQYIQRRNDLERRIVTLSKQIERAESVATQINVVFNYLTKDFLQIGELVEDARQKQEFGFRIIEAQEEERKRVSREIHDGPAQTLAHILIRADLVDRIGRERGLEVVLDEVKYIKTHVRNALYDVRRLIYDLRPMALDDLGLVPTLNKYLKTVEEYSSVEVDFVHLGMDERLPSQFEVACFRLIQEAVQNACKHGEAKLLKVNIEIRHELVTIIIRDDGKGFDTEKIKEGSFGIIGMKERVNLLNGEIAYKSKIGEGTTILVKLPFTR